MRLIWKTGPAAVLGTAILVSAFAAPFLSPPRPDHIAGILFNLAFDDKTSIDAIMEADPSATLVDMRLRGRLVFVHYAAAAFPERVSRLGALHTFDAVTAGCHRSFRDPQRGS